MRSPQRTGRPATRPVGSCDDVEHPHPAELSELRLVRVEHVLPRVGEAQLENVALPLSLDDGVGVLRRFERRPGREAVEEVPWMWNELIGSSSTMFSR